jgi:two-component system NtrC family sensor kinase
MKVFSYKIILFVFFAVVAVSVYGQNHKLDSLKRVLQTEKEDTNRVKTLIELSWETNDNKTSRHYADEALALSNKLAYIRGKGDAYYRYGKIHYALGNDSAALKSYFMALSVRKQENDQERVANTLLMIGEVFQKTDLADAIKYNQSALETVKKMGYKDRIFDIAYNLSQLYNSNHNYRKAVITMTNALEFFKNIGDKKRTAIAYQLLAAVYMVQNNLPENLKNLYISLKLYQQLADKYGIATNLQYIGAAYQGMGNYSDALKSLVEAAKIRQQIGDKIGSGQTYATIAELYSSEGRYPEALQNVEVALQLFQKPEMPSWGIPMCYGIMGRIYERQGDSALSKRKLTDATINYSKAEKYYLLALEKRKADNSSQGITESYTAIGGVELKLKHFFAAKAYLKKGLKLSLAFNVKRNLQYIYLSLSELDTIEGNYKQAYIDYTKHILYRDSTFNDEDKTKAVQIKMQSEFDKKEAIASAEQAKKDAEAKRVKDKQYFTIAALGVIVFAILAIALIQLRNNKQKQKANIVLQHEKQKVESTLLELKATQTQLIQSEKMASLGELTAGIAHEIQNPLNFVNNFSDVNSELIEELEQEADKGNFDEVKSIANDIKENEQKINHHGKRADAIVKGMLQHSRASTGKKELTDINALADEYLRLSYHGLRAKDKEFNADIKTDFDETIGKIEVVQQDIGRVLLNLYNNAFYAVNEKKRQLDGTFEPAVAVTTKRTGHKVEILVKDNGYGIPQKVVDKIFQPFFTTKPTGQGTGLGLSLSYDIIKVHGGELKVETKEGEGAAFIVQLPAI